MLLIFNKQFRTEEKIISELIKKIKKSKVIVLSYIGDAEVYALDNIDISLDVVKHELVVTDKSDKNIVTMDCNYDAFDEKQQARSDWFSEVLEQARDRYGKELNLIKKQEKFKNANQKVLMVNNLKKKQQAEQNAMVEALGKIKSL